MSFFEIHKTLIFNNLNVVAMKKSLSVFIILLLLEFLGGASVFALTITKSGGWLETAYVEWSPVSGATSYTVTYTGGGKTNQQIDTELIRNYSTAGHWRADVLGLKAGTYSITVTGGGQSATVSNIVVKAHDRSGFAHSSQSTWGTASGAYNEDGTLKSTAKVIYVTATNSASTTSYTLTRPDGSTGTYTGIADALLNAFQKAGTSGQPLAVRIIGKVTNDQVGVGTGTDALLQIKGKTDTTTFCQVTIEGVGNDATAYGWGVKVVKCGDVEVRNLGVMMFGDDGTQIQDGNKNIWVHNCDYFYGAIGSAADQVKGDGSLDSKESSYCTYSYNHFWDAGKCNLLGMHDPERGYLTYHHNWYDHSDSRHPRARVHWAHVYNNYYDGVAEYGAGATECANLFCEGNYFKNTNRPMVISMQGNGGDTFSGETGGMIKSFNNTFDNCTNYIPYSTNNTNFDFYDASSRTETVPSSVAAVLGGCTFTNLTITTLNATADDPSTAKANVISYAGRCEGGDLKFQFTDADNDKSHDRISGISTVLDNYTSTGEITVYDPNTGLEINQSVPSLTLTSATSTTAQSVAKGSAITAITYTIGGTATSAAVTGLPTGLSGTLSGTTFTISGTVSSSATAQVYTYTVSTTPTGATATGTITVTTPVVALSTPTNVTESHDNSSITVNWTQVTNATGYLINLCTNNTTGVSTKTWDFTGTWTINASSADANLVIDTGNSDRFNYAPSTTAAALTFASGTEIPDVAGLKFTQGGTSKLRLGFGATTKQIYLNGSALKVFIPCQIGDTVKVIGPSGNTTSVDRGYTVSGGTLNATKSLNISSAGIMNVAGAIGTWVIDATSTEVSLTTVTGGMNIQKIIVVTATGSSASTCTEYTISSGSTTSYKISGLTAETTYTYQIKATSSNSSYTDSPYTTAASVTTGVATKELLTKNSDFSLIQTNDALTVSGVDAVEMSLYNLLGEQIARTNEEVMKIDYLNTGVYLVVVKTTDNKIFSKKIIK